MMATSQDDREKINHKLQQVDEDEDENIYSESFEDESIHEDKSDLDNLIVPQSNYSENSHFQFKSPKIYQSPTNRATHFSDVDESSTDEKFLHENSNQGFNTRTVEISSGGSSPESHSRVNRFQYSDQDEDEDEYPSTKINNFLTPSNRGINPRPVALTDPSISASLSGGSESSTPSHQHVVDEASNPFLMTGFSEQQSLLFDANLMPRPHFLPNSIALSSSQIHISNAQLSPVTPPLIQDPISLETTDYYSPYSHASHAVSHIAPNFQAHSEEGPSFRTSIQSTEQSKSPVADDTLETRLADVASEENVISSTEVSWPWIQYQTEEGWTYYYNQVTGESSWDYPDQHSLHGEEIMEDYSSLIKQEQEEKVPTTSLHQQINQYDISEDSDLSSCTSLDIKADLNSVHSRSVSQSGMIEQKNKHGQSALHISALSANVDALCLLLSTGLDPNILDGNGNTAMHIICNLIPSKDQALCIQSLVSYHANPNIQDASGNTPIHVLLLSKSSSEVAKKDNIQEYQIKSLEAILQGYVDLSIANSEGEQPLHIATRLGLLGCMQLLLKYSSSIPHQDFVPKKSADDESIKSKESGSKLLRKGSSRSNKSNVDHSVSKNFILPSANSNSNKSSNYIDLKPIESMGEIVHYYSSSDDSRHHRSRPSKSHTSDEKRKRKETKKTAVSNFSNPSRALPDTWVDSIGEVIVQVDRDSHSSQSGTQGTLEVTPSQLGSLPSDTVDDIQSLGQLRDGWVEYCTEEGDKYYYDSKTGLVQWKHPYQEELDRKKELEQTLVVSSIPVQAIEVPKNVEVTIETKSSPQQLAESNIQSKLRQKHKKVDKPRPNSLSSKSSGMKTMTIEANPSDNFSKTLAHHGSMRTISLTPEVPDTIQNGEIEHLNEISNRPTSTFVTPPGKEKNVVDSMAASIPFPSMSRIPSVSSISVESDTSKESKRHLEVWNRFFENAMLVNQAREDSDAGSRFRSRKGISVGGFTPSFVRKKVSLSGKDDWNLPPSSAEYEELVSKARDLTSPSRSSAPASERVAEVGNWALLAAVMRGDVNTADDLLLNGVNPSCIDDQIRTPLHHACRSGDVKLISLLSDYGGDLDSLDSKGQSPLHIACDYNHTNAVQCLLQCGASTDLIDNHGNSPLHIVAHNGNIDCCQILLEYGAQIDLKNSKGQTPLDVARGALTTSQGSRPSLGVRKIIAALTAAQPDINTTLFSLEGGNNEAGHLTSDEILINSTVDEEYSLPSESVYEEDYKEAADKQINYQETNPRPIRSDSISSLSVNSDGSHDDSLKKQKKLRHAQKKSHVNNAEAKRNEWIQRGKVSNQHSQQGIAIPNSNATKPLTQQRNSLLDHSHPASHLTIQTDATYPGEYEPKPTNSAYNYYDQPVIPVVQQINSPVSEERSDLPEKIPQLTGSKVVSNVVWGAVSLLDATWKMFSQTTSSPEETSPTEKDSPWNSTAPPTDQELLRRGLGFHFEPHVVPASPRPPAIVLEDLKAHTEAYKNSNTPRGSFIPPPDEVVVAVEMARAAERHRRTPSRPISNSGSPPKLSAYPKPPLEVKNNRNGYSMGPSLPKGVSWRYVDVLNQDDRTTPR